MSSLDTVCSFCGPGQVDLADLVQLVPTSCTSSHWLVGGTRHPGGGSATSVTDRAKKQDSGEEADWRKRFIPLREGAVWEMTRGAQNILNHDPCFQAHLGRSHAVYPGLRLVFQLRLSAVVRYLRQSCHFERRLDREWGKVDWKWGFFREF